MAGISVPDEVSGSSLGPFTQGNSKDWRTEFFCEHLFDMPYIPKSEGVRTTKWKYFRYLEHPDAEELYDLENDPLELQNLATKPDYQANLEMLRKRTGIFINDLK